MKTQNKTILLGIILITTLLNGCMMSNNILVTPTLMPTATANIPTNTPLPTQTVTLTPPATLKPHVAQETMRTLLLEPLDCLAPCFWGIAPDQTTLGEAKNIFTRFDLILEYTTKTGTFEFYNINYDFDSDLSISLNLIVQKGIVKNIVVNIHPEFQKVGIQREWSIYSPETLIRS